MGGTHPHLTTRMSGREAFKKKKKRVKREEGEKRATAVLRCAGGNILAYTAQREKKGVLLGERDLHVYKSKDRRKRGKKVAFGFRYKETGDLPVAQRKRKSTGEGGKGALLTSV